MNKTHHPKFQILVKFELKDYKLIAKRQNLYYPEFIFLHSLYYFLLKNYITAQTIGCKTGSRMYCTTEGI